MNTNAVHPGSLNAAQAIAFFKANGIKGKIVKQNKHTQLREYHHLVMFLNGTIGPTTTRIQALPKDF